jgi:hypothetical protein
MLDVYTDNTLPKPMFESSTLSTPGIRLYFGCGTNANVDIGQWVTEWQFQTDQA